MDRIEAPAEQSGLRSVDVERNTKREHLSSTDQARRLDDVLRGHMIERADLVVFSPPAPVFQLLRCFGDCLSTDLDVHFRPQVSCCPAAKGRFYGRIFSVTQMLCVVPRLFPAR